MRRDTNNGGNGPTKAEDGEARPDRLARLARAHWPVVVVLGIMTVAFLVRLHYLARHSEYTADSYYFLILARSIRDTFTYTVRGVTHIKYLPGYPIATWLGGYLSGGLENSANMIALLGGSLTVLTTYGIGRELMNRWTGLVAALIVAFAPTFLKWTCLPMTEGLFTFLFSGGIYLVITGCKRASMPRRMLGALAGGLCFLTRWEGILFLPLMVLIVMIFIRGSRLKPWEPPVMLALFGGPMVIYMARNKIATGSMTAYTGEYDNYTPGVTFSILKHRLKVYAWNGTSDAIFSVLFYAGAFWCLIRKRWKAFLVVGGWFGLFVVFHMFWYYSYERFMAPAAPAVALMIGFLLVDLATSAGKVFGSEGQVAARTSGGKLQGGTRTALLASARWLAWLALACLLVVTVTHGLVRADRVIEENYKAFADDHGGKGIGEAALWLEENAPGQAVAVDAGPYFQWLYSSGEVLYLRPVPWDLPVEDRDVEHPDVPGKLYQRGVRYMVIGQTEKGVDDELKLFGIVDDARQRVREIARWVNHYEYPEPHDLETVIFEVLPPN
ncbi:MAG: glycosyltransferase family 39 protein [Actinobacteria bacterium]|nr:glycosyltransferase family 39 protein [Actinomycetota bacterium]MBU4392994.1 glycosyltransferase family 39 protein [Actinomycetota bacterium]MBU4402117.1 glycosyltransferase family 39 protein [Actinomycetota bacterium]MBU4442063.1 glycosyltransferase family 39 protein [Actinomycetota bacterium]